MTDSSNAELPLEIIELRNRLRQLTETSPTAPEEVARAQERMSDLEARLSTSDELVERIRLEREIAAIALAIANQVRAHTEQRRQHRRAVFDARRALYDHVVSMHEELIVATKATIRSLVNSALDELDRLESQRSALLQATIPVALDEVDLPTLRRMLHSAHKLTLDRGMR